jgi:polyisoprenoid-binding protein YceI
VTEQLANRNFPSDAVGTTNAISGQIVIGSDGKVDPQQSDFKINLTTLTSDSRGRDGFIQRNTLQTDQFPSAEFVPAEQQGLSVPLPTSGQVTFQLSGNLTLHGVTRPTTWDVTAQVQGNQLTGKATTAFKFEDFGMQPPKAFIVLSVQDNIRLEYDFALALATPAGLRRQIYPPFGRTLS